MIAVENNFTKDYYIKKIVKRICLNELIKNCLDTENIIKYCRECKNYNNIWSCPPYSFNALDLFEKYRYAYIIAYKIYINKSRNNNGYDLINNIIVEVRKSKEPSLLLIEKKYKNSYVLYAGSCILCEDCLRKCNKECIHKDSMRYSLESLGFDVQKISKEFLDIEIKWATDGKLPEYFTLISGILTNSIIDELEDNIDSNN